MKGARRKLMLKILRRLNGKEWAQAGISLLFIVAQVWLDLKLPDYMSDITRLTQTEGSAMADIWTAGGYMLLCALGSLAASVIVGFFAARIAASFSRRLRSGLFAKVDAFSMHEISRFSTASLITRSTNDITQIQLFHHDGPADDRQSADHGGLGDYEDCRKRAGVDGRNGRYDCWFMIAGDFAILMALRYAEV